ncbi:MAG: hypothetical protein WAP23_00990 [Candidatus Spechtbacterales bacterium]
MENQIQGEQNIERNNSQFTKKQRRELRREEKRTEQEKAHKAKGRKNIVVWALLSVAIAAAGLGIFRYLFSEEVTSGEFDVTNACVNHGGISMHIHADLRIVINGDAEVIPENIGVTPGCMRPLHTHDSTGRLHIEFPRQHNFILGEFFKIWDKPFPSEISMTVNGEDNAEFGNLILKDGDRIEIRYGDK